jgi:hypothetical protein
MLSMPQLALVQLFSSSDRNLLYHQYNSNYHPMFILTRLVQILAGLATVLLVYWVLARECDPSKALLGAAIMAFMPIAIQFFPNAHQDAVFTPFAFAAAYQFHRQRFVWAGVWLGLALGSKNTAIFLLPVMLAVAVSRMRPFDMPDSAERWRVQLRGLLSTGVLALIVMTPFGSPISYAQEVLTPITHRAYDPRGLNVESFTLTGRAKGQSEINGTNATATVPTSGAAEAATPSGFATWVEGTFAETNPAARMAHMLLRLETSDFFFLALGILLLWNVPRGSFAQMAYWFLLIGLPYGIMFGYGLAYRYLVFVPFFAALCVLMMPKRALVTLIALLLCVDVIYCSDPLSSGGMLHSPANRATLWQSLTSQPLR